MIKKTTIKFDIEVNEDNTASKEIEYKNYSKNSDNEENLLTYKNIIKYDADGNKCENKETFNKIIKTEENVDEMVGNSANNNDWKILEYKNHILEKDYSKIYDNIKLDINYDIIKNCEDKKYIVDK
jgi:hypothetical protein|uniref:Uncharacterized protein n=1 Tax=viral metagenome TaxID=1070528 RepID=A0A6C0LBC4_9ZZZZ